MVVLENKHNAFLPFFLALLAADLGDCDERSRISHVLAIYADSRIRYGVSMNKEFTSFSFSYYALFRK